MAQLDKQPEQRAAPRGEFSDLADEQQAGLIREFWDFLKYNKKWWLTPIIVVLLLVAGVAVMASLYPAAVPFIYSGLH